MALENSKLDSYKVNVKAASTANVTLNISMLNGTWVYPIIDGYQTVKGDRVLLKDQTDAKTNGIYSVQPGKLHLATDNNNNTSLINGATVKVLNGTINAGKSFETPAVSPFTYNTTNKVWTEVVGGSAPELVFAADLAAIQLLTGELDKQYIAEDTGKLYRWNGVSYIEISSGAGLPVVRYVYLVQDASDAILMGGTASNVYSTAQAAYNAAVALQALNGGIVVIRIGNITQALAGDITLTADMTGVIKFEGINKQVSFIRDIISEGFNASIAGNDFTMRNIITTPTVSGISGIVTLNTLAEVTVGNITTSGNAAGANAGGNVTLTNLSNVIAGIITTSGSILGGNGGIVSIQNMSGSNTSSIITDSPLGNSGNVTVNNIYTANILNIQTNSSDTGNGGTVNLSTPRGTCRIGGITSSAGPNGNGNAGAVTIAGNEGSGYIYGANIIANGAGTGNGGAVTLSYCKGYVVTSNGGATSGNAGNISLTYFATNTTGATIQTHYGVGTPTLSLIHSQVRTVTQTNNSTANFGTVTLRNSIIEQNYLKTQNSTGGFGNYTISDTSTLTMNIPSVAIDGMTLFNLTEAVWSNGVITKNVNISSATPETITSINGIQTGGVSANYIIRFTNTGANTVTFDSATINTKSGSDVVLATGDWIEIFNNNEYNSSIGPVTKTVKVTLTPAQINAAATPVELIPAPGIGKAIECTALSAKLNFVSVAYDANPFGIGIAGAFQASSDSASQFQIFDLWLNGNSGWSTFRRHENLSLGQAAQMMAENAAIVFEGVNSVAVGDSPVDLYITYVVHTV